LNNIDKKIKLGVNIDHIATLRNARGESFPDIINAAKIALNSGADSITAHLREDRRHINDLDIEKIVSNFPGKLNLEMASTKEMLDIALKIKPFSCCIVPEKREELTTEGGLDVRSKHNQLKDFINPLKDLGIRTSFFIDADETQLSHCVDLGVDCVEIHCGSYCRAFDNKLPSIEDEFLKIKNISELAHNEGIEVHAGHGLNYSTTKYLSSIHEIEELNIGFFIISESIFKGLDRVIVEIQECMKQGRALGEEN
jgi:pyridoxine 5-phosphate synthase|tara:strand:- start:60 stop:824 length:765 start_codon:yes stop_codon:yes gene_type:complete